MKELEMINKLFELREFARQNRATVTDELAKLRWSLVDKLIMTIVDIIS